MLPFIKKELNMAYGIEIRNAAGNIVMDMSTPGIQFIEQRIITYGASGSITYTYLTGRTLKVFQLNRLTHNYSVSVDASSNPVFTYTARVITNTGRRFDSTFIIFAS